MKIPPSLNLVRLTGLGQATPPRGFRRVRDLPGDRNHYAVRVGYRLEPCAGAVHKRGPGLESCSLCEPYHGAVALGGERAPRVTSLPVGEATP